MLQNLDGVTMINNLCQKLSEKFVAPIDIITGDVLKLLQGLADKRLYKKVVIHSLRKLPAVRSEMAQFSCQAPQDY